jgi:hypothetical protein
MSKEEEEEEIAAAKQRICAPIELHVRGAHDHLREGAADATISHDRDLMALLRSKLRRHSPDATDKNLPRRIPSNPKDSRA